MDAFDELQRIVPELIKQVAQHAGQSDPVIMAKVRPIRALCVSLMAALDQVQGLSIPKPPMPPLPPSTSQRRAR